MGWWIAIGVVAALLVVRRVLRRHACGRGGRGAGAWWMRRRVDRVMARLGATEEQRARVRVLEASLVGDLAGLASAHRTLRDEIAAALAAPERDAARLRAAVHARADALRAFGARVADALVEVDAMLTDVQRASLARHLARRPVRA